MISDEFETFGNNHFWRGQTKVKIFIQKIIHFWKIQNIHSKQIFIFLNIQNIHSKQIFIFLKSRIFIQKNYSFFWNTEYSLKEYQFWPGLPPFHDHLIFGPPPLIWDPELTKLCVTWCHQTHVRRNGFHIVEYYIEL